MGLLLLDTRNAFTSLNRAAALWNCSIQWPGCSRVLFNTYCGYATVMLEDNKNNKFLLSKEGIGQGELRHSLSHCRTLLPGSKIGSWFDKICEHGPKYGHYPEVDKCIIIVDGNREGKAKSSFEHLGVKVVKRCRF